jgi:hypothetical protein
MTNSCELAPMEYVIPAGVPYNDCYTRGDCPPDVLEQLYDTEMSLEIIYLSVAEPQAGGGWVSLRMAGPEWEPGDPGGSPLQDTSASNGTLPASLQTGPEGTTMNHRIYIPFMTGGSERTEPTDCPCGWFDTSGRMLYYLPGP